MTTCWEGHDEIVHEGRNCPACELKNERDNLEKENTELRDRITELE